MARKKNSTKPTEVPEVQPKVVSEEVERGETQPPVTNEEIVALIEEEDAKIPEIVQEMREAAETNSITNLPLEEGEEVYTVTKADLEANPQLVEEGVQEGEQIVLGPAVTPEEVILDALAEEEDFVEINEVLEQFVNDAESQQGNRFLKKLLSGMVTEGQIEIQNQVHLLLGSAYYKAGDPVTRYQTLRTVPVYAKKKG
jgi:hypothetical protein